ncbi:MAG: hypothetical protein ACOC0Q_07275 [Wenzhouxiangella sp.]
MSNGDGKYNGQHLISGGRLVELVVVALVSAAISGGITAFVATAVLQEQLANLKESQDHLRRELQELRRDIYRPAWPGPGESTMQIEPTELLTELRASLHDAAQYFHGTETNPDADLERHLIAAAADLAERRGITHLAELEIEAGVSRYTGLPTDIVYIKTLLWGSQERTMPWSDSHPGPLPRARLAREQDAPVLYLTPAPTEHQIAALGSRYAFFYGASYWTGNLSDALELSATERSLLLLRAQAEACRELAMQNMTRPVETRTSLSMPRNSTPGALWQALMDEFRRRVGAPG